MPEVFDFLKISSESLHALSVPEKAAGGGTEKVKAPPKGKSPVPDATPVPVEGAMDRQPIDEKLTLSIVETLVEFLEGRGDYQEAYTSAMATINLDTSNNKNNNCGPIISPFARRRLCESATRCAGRLSIKPGQYK